MSVDEYDVLRENAAFYDAINGRDAERMDDLWARAAAVACVHPGWEPLLGRADVLRSWRAILEGPEPPRIECSDAVAHVYGTTAFVVCFEVLDAGRLVATNIFTLEGGRWLLVHHHAGPTARAPRRTSPPPRRDLN